MSEEMYQQNTNEGLHHLNLDEVMQTFGVPAWHDLGPLEVPPGAFVSHQVEIAGQHYILRERPEGMQGEDLRHRYDFPQYLQRAGIPIPPFWQTPQGEFAVTLGEYIFELQRWPGGELFGSTDPQHLVRIKAAGNMLGRIHQTSQHYPGPHHRWPSEAHIGAIVQNYLNLAHARAETSPVAALATALTEWAEQWEAILPSAMMAIGSARDLPELHIHGDYHALNLRFHDGAVSSVVGLEASRWEKRLFEVASALFSFSALSWLPGSASTPPLVKRGFDPERAHAFLQGYAEFCPPSLSESTHLADALLLVAPIISANGPLEDIFYAPETWEGVVLDEVLASLAWAASLPAWLKRVRHSLSELWH